VGAWLASRTGFSSGAVTALLAVTVSGPACVNSAWFDIVLARTDTRVLASQWLRPRLLAEESVHDAGIVYTRLDLSGARFRPWGADPAFDPTSPSFGHPAGPIPDWLVLYDSPLQLYAQTPAPLRDLAKEKYDLAFTARGVKDETASAVYDLQDAFFLPVSGLATVERPGPTISIYRRKD
jgi:hypothetical protein